MSVNFPSPEIADLQRHIEIGGEASNILASKEWFWIQDKIFGALQDQAINSLKNARTEEDRVKAQQQFLAAHRPKEILDSLISTGKAAKVGLEQISTLEGENNG